MYHYHTKILIRQITEQLIPIYHDNATAQHKAWEMLSALTKKNVTQLMVTDTLNLSDTEKERLHFWLTEITTAHMPFEYAIGEINFLNLSLTIKPPILIPRPETEEWCAFLIKKLNQKPPRMLLDLCTGSGCLALALAQTFPQGQTDAIDNAPHALASARKNAEQNDIHSINFILSDLYHELPKKRVYDLIVSNPPYISFTEWENLDLSVKNWEDPHALIASEDGLALIKKIILNAPIFLKEKGELWVEIGYTQGERVKDFFTQAGFDDITIFKDMHHNDRVVYGTLKH